MKIKGIQKVTLIDYPNKIACTLFLFGCNFRCGFCHNPELVIEEKEKDISEKEILDYLDKRKKYLEGVCITGGEPLLTIDKRFLKNIKNLDYNIKLDTNGSFPEKLEELINEKLIDFVAMDIKTTKEKYSTIINSNIDISKIEKSIQLICSLHNYEFRTTIIPELHSKEDIKELSLWLNNICGKKPKKFCLQSFKNSGKFIDNSFNNFKNTKKEYLLELKNYIIDYFEEIEIRN